MQAARHAVSILPAEPARPPASATLVMLPLVAAKAVAVTEAASADVSGSNNAHGQEHYNQNDLASLRQAAQSSSSNS